MKTSSRTAPVAGQAAIASKQAQKYTLLKWQLFFWFLVLLTLAVLYWGFAPNLPK
jgi:hypothetical protein